jgi:hypothetical protein
LLLSVYAAAASPLHSSGPLTNLNVVVLDAAARPIVGATLTIGAEARRTDGGGFVNFAVPGPVLVNVVAPGLGLGSHLQAARSAAMLVDRVRCRGAGPRVRRRPPLL